MKAMKLTSEIKKSLNMGTEKDIYMIDADENFYNPSFQIRNEDSTAQRCEIPASTQNRRTVLNANLPIIEVETKLDFEKKAPVIILK